MSFQKVLDKYREFSFSERDKGDRFERLIQAYLQTDPTYSNTLKYVWMWNEFPGKKDFGGKDTGIDLVALTIDGDYWAIQCKCYKESGRIDKAEVDSFLSTSSRHFKNDQLQTIGFEKRIWVSTTNNWSSNAEETIRNQNPPVTRINLTDLEQAPVDWGTLEKGITGDLARTTKKTLRQHQTDALNNTHDHFLENDRGKLIMACGTGKTFTSLRIAENETNNSGLVLFLVPSIALLGQTLREWSSDANEPIKPICICSDSRITRQSGNNDDDDFSVVDLAFPASTDVKSVIKQFKGIDRTSKKGMTVVFSTYQSIDVIANAQRHLLNEKNNNAIFDLIICDEAHRTTGVTLAGNDESSFVKVHDNEFLQANKRIYMTATPRLFSDDSKSKADQNEATICSMDDPEKYGEEMYRIGFGEAVERGLLADYKVLVLTLSENDIPPAVQKMVSNSENEINSDDASKLIGCLNALSKQVLGDNGLIKDSDPEPMKRAVAFCQNIKISKKITSTFNDTSDVYLDSVAPKHREKLVRVSSNHIDGSMNAPQRDQLLGWLKSQSADSNECRVLTNVRCLSEGVDVPSLDAVLFLSARNSQVDVVQSVGRVMRKAPGKKYGYIIIPVVVPSDVEPSKALDDNDRFRVVWSVLNALRAHDDRFNATVNKIDLNKKKPNNILIGGVPRLDADGNVANKPNEKYGDVNDQLAIQFEQLQSIVYAKMVQKVGDRVYWEKWAKDVAKIAENQVARIKVLIENSPEHEAAFEKFLTGLRKNINPSISKEQAIDMLSQHIITKPVFEALFDGYSFVKNNAISTSMQSMLDVLEDQSLDKDTETLDKFYQSVKKRAEGIDNSEGKQRIIIELYDKFFKTAFPKMVEQLGIVYTPIEVVDFIIHSVNDVLQKEFNRSISDDNVHVLDPFTGTGTFITRLLQSGLIKKEDLKRKYTQELHANEIVLLAYYIAAVNIENAFHDQIEQEETEFTSFDGIVLTDTFQLGETNESEKLFSEMFPQNSKRVQAQQKAPLRVIMGNPPYSAGQKSANDDAENQEYIVLDSKISKTYAELSNATNKNALYDSYMKAFRWSTDRLDPKNGGIIAFVSNGAWLEGNSTDGFRQSLEEEFSTIYIFNLRGNQRTSGELSRKEGGKIFGSGSRTPISITLLVKKPDNIEKAKIHYHDIGDYLNQKEKLDIISNFKSIKGIDWKILSPNDHNDWINQRNDSFINFHQLTPTKKYNYNTKSVFNLNSMGIGTSRDAWVYNFSKKQLSQNLISTIKYYNSQIDDFKLQIESNPKLDVKKFIGKDPTKISWSSSLIPNVKRGNKTKFDSDSIVTSNYRPFNKQFLYYGDKLIHRSGQFKDIFPEKLENKIIAISSTNKGLGLLISNTFCDTHFNGDTQCLPLYIYHKREQVQGGLFDVTSESSYIRKDGVSDFILERAKKQYGKSVSKVDIFYYVYGILHSQDYRETFANDLKKMLPRIPLVEKPKDFWAFSKSGYQLAELHINYEDVEPFTGVEVEIPKHQLQIDEYEFYKVTKLRFPKKDQKETIIYNSRIKISNIPAQAYEYLVNGKSAIDWIMDRYQVVVDKKSGIKNDPNDWSKEVENPRYILDLILSVINVSVQTVDIVNGLPELKFEEEAVDTLV